MSVRQAFAEPLISTEGVTASTALLSADLCHRLDAAGQGGLRFTLGLYRADGSASHVGIGLSRPCRETGHLIALLAEKLAGLDAGFGVDVMTLSAIEVATLTPRQTALSVPGMTAVAADTSALVDRLSNRLGPARVQHLVAADSHSPERAQQRRPALTDARAILPARRGEARLRHDARPANPTRVGQCDPDLLAGQVVPARRPPVLLPAPEPILVTAELPEGPPQCFTWRRLVRRVLRAEGPERIEPEWWRSIGRDCHRAAHDDRPRDYYAIEAAGGARYWVYRAGLYGCDDDRPPAWFLHGVFA